MRAGRIEVLDELDVVVGDATTRSSWSLVRSPGSELGERRCGYEVEESQAREEQDLRESHCCSRVCCADRGVKGGVRRCNGSEFLSGGVKLKS